MLIVGFSIFVIMYDELKFEMQMKLLQTAESNEQRASQILSIRG